MATPLDRRTQSDDDVVAVSIDEFFTGRFPALSAANGHLVSEAMQVLGAPPLTVEVEGAAWTITTDAGRVTAVRGEVGGALVVTFSPEEFSDWCQNQRSLNSFTTARTLRARGGSRRDVSIWDSLLMTLLYGWPTVGQVEFVDRHGAPLDLTRWLGPDDHPADIAHFLREAGFLHLRGWVDPAVMADISTDMSRMLPTYTEGDGKSWWAQVASGERVCVRMQEFVDHSPATAAMLCSERWQQLRRTIAADDPLVQAPVEGRCIEALVKPVGVVSGPSDLNFHRDCHLGRHAYSCSGTTVGVSVTGSSAANGLLRVVPGSHRIAMPVEVAIHEPFMQAVPLATEPGDLTVHLSCTLHEATAPLVHERRVMYTGFQLQPVTGRRAKAHADLAELREQVTNLLRDQAV